MGRNTSESEWFSMQNETVTSVQLRNVGKWLCQVKCVWGKPNERRNANGWGGRRRTAAGGAGR